MFSSVTIKALELVNKAEKERERENLGGVKTVRKKGDHKKLFSFSHPFRCSCLEKRRCLFSANGDAVNLHDVRITMVTVVTIKAPRISTGRLPEYRL